jgi:hypothetical protein
MTNAGVLIAPPGKVPVAGVAQPVVVDPGLVEGGDGEVSGGSAATLFHGASSRAGF